MDMHACMQQWMRLLNPIKNKNINMRKTYIIGEIGQNHNGSVDIAKLIIELICRPIEEDVFGLDLQPMDAVKMTRRDLKESN